VLHGVHTTRPTLPRARLTLPRARPTLPRARPTPPRARLLTAAALLGGVLVAGCGGSSPSPTVARLGSASTSGSTAVAGDGGASSGSPSPSAPGLAALAFAKCMRSNGVPGFPDPQAGGGFLFRADAGIDPPSPAFKAAQAKCHKLLPGGGPPGPGSTTNPSPQTLAHYLEVAQCMRKQGVYDFPDPRTSVPSNPFGSAPGGGVISDIEGVILVFPSTIDQQSTTFTRAAAACAFPLHNH
jgi:hypothetical protein